MDNITQTLIRGASGGGAIKDSNFNQVALLLHGDGTNGSQNNTFVDSSTNNFSITRNGNSTQGSFSPFSLPEGQWSNFFDDTGDYLEIPNNVALQVGSSDFTFEALVYMTRDPAANQRWFTKGFTTTSNFECSLMMLTNYQLVFRYSTTGSNTFDIASTGLTVSTWLNKWNHVAVSKSGTTVKVFLNGTQVATGTVSTIFAGTAPFRIGCSGAATPADFWNGYISNERLVKGTALYTANFTPPTTPLTAITNTSLLTCQSNRFIDNSSNNFAITRNGDVRVTPWSPFAPTSAYDPATNGGSGYFDGTGDHLSVPAISTLATSFTIEFWAYFSNADSTRFDFFGLGGSAFLYRPTGNTLNWYIGSDRISGSFTQATHGGRWNHIAICRDSSNNTRLFVNGTQLGSTYTSDTSTYSSTGPTIGWNSGGNHVNGYISNFRIVNGTAVYTSAFTPPTAPVTNITNTSLLLNFTNAGIFDNAAKNVIETVGNAQISTSVTKFGTGSMYFDGSGDIGQISNAAGNQHLIVGTADQTIEAWVYVVGSGSEGSNPADGMIYGKTSVFGVAANFFNEAFYTNATNRTVTFNANTADGQTQVKVVTPNNSISLNTWHHVAFVKSGTTWTIYVDGVNRVSATRQHFGTTTGFVAAVGRNANSSSFMYPFNGYIDDLRVTNGLARYTADFTPPSAPYPDL
jgi:hypothetical protein